MGRINGATLVMKVLLERFPYRFCEEPDRGYIQKYNLLTKRWFHLYECDCELQMSTAMGDINYVRWLDPEGEPINVNNSVSNPYNK